MALDAQNITKISTSRVPLTEKEPVAERHPFDNIIRKAWESLISLVEE